jgi:hypothetical protein
VRFAEYSQSSKPAVWAALPVLALSGSCTSRIEPFKTTVVEGTRFAHFIELPSDLLYPKEPGAWFRRKFLVMDLHGRWEFRHSRQHPDRLLIGACSPYRIQPPVCSENRFAIETARSYSVRPATEQEWSEAPRVVGLQTLGNFISRFPKKVAEGFEYKSHTYPVRGAWIERRRLVESTDGRIIVVASDREKAPPERGTAVIDVFNGHSGRRLAAVDREYSSDLEGALHGVFLLTAA